MRIAIVNWSNRQVGGVETYLNSVLPQLSSAGHTLAFLHEVDPTPDREKIKLPDGVPVWCVGTMGVDEALKAVRDWEPDVIYAHGLLDPKLEAATIKIAPAVFFAHNYYGTCISGAKTFKSPVVQPCDRRFGPKCLFHYFPHRCGGLNPLTMLELYRLQAKRLKLMPSYKAIVTHSEHMRQEYLKHGIESNRIYDLLYYVRDDQPGANLPAEVVARIVKNSNGEQAELNANEDAGNGHQRSEWRLLFLGRMDFLKGGSVFLDALPQMSASLKRPLRATFIGDGPARSDWEQQAGRIRSRYPDLSIEFTGWLKGPPLDSSIKDCDLLVLPSLWPEPFGLVGPEMGLRGVPVAAFAVGGIPNWLIDGLNGYLAPGDPPTAAGLADAVFKCLNDPATYARLRRGAAEIARRFDMQTHVDALLNVFAKVIRDN